MHVWMSHTRSTVQGSHPCPWIACAANPTNNPWTASGQVNGPTGLAMCARGCRAVRPRSRAVALAVLVPGAGAARPGQLVDRDTHARVAHGHYRRKQQAERLSALAAGAQGPGPPHHHPGRAFDRAKAELKAEEATRPNFLLFSLLFFFF